MLKVDEGATGRSLYLWSILCCPVPSASVSGSRFLRALECRKVFAAQPVGGGQETGPGQ
jgi:hypothetical protein